MIMFRRMWHRRRSRHQRKVDKFMRKASQFVPRYLHVPDEEVRRLRATLILEEAFETIEKGLGIDVIYNGYRVDVDELQYDCVRRVDLKEVADGCADIKVVTTGTLTACGMSDLKLQDMIDDSNIRKFKGDAYRREDGKWIKPTDWKAPDIEGYLTWM